MCKAGLLNLVVVAEAKRTRKSEVGVIDNEIKTLRSKDYSSSEDISDGYSRSILPLLRISSSSSNVNTP
jgi:hypothetical protein